MRPTGTVLIRRSGGAGSLAQSAVRRGELPESSRAVRGSSYPPASSHAAQRIHAFTLIEVIIVLVIVGLLAATAVPAMSSLGDTRRVAALREVERRLTNARSTAMTTGQPTGLAVSATADTLLSVFIPSAGATPAPITTPSGEPDDPVLIAEEFPGVDIATVIAGDGASGDTTFWFSFEGTPQLRSSSGTLTGGFVQDASIHLAGGGQINIRRISGLIER